MAARSYNLTVGATPVRLSDAYIGSTRGGPGGPAENIGGAAGSPDARSDIAYRQILLQADTADIVVGVSSAVTTSSYGVKCTQAAPAPVVTIGPFETGPVKLSDLWAVSAGAGTLHVLGIPF